MERRSEGAAPQPSTGELSSLSRLFGVLIDHRLVESNPVKLVKRLSEKSGERQAYLSFKDIQAIIDKCPEWFRPIVLTAYYTGMRRGEILGLTRKQVNLSSRIITLYPVSSDKGGDKRSSLETHPDSSGIGSYPSGLPEGHFFRDGQGFPHQRPCRNPSPL